jgi:hypothetical protein
MSEIVHIVYEGFMIAENTRQRECHIDPYAHTLRYIVCNNECVSRLEAGYNNSTVAPRTAAGGKEKNPMSRE